MRRLAPLVAAFLVVGMPAALAAEPAGGTTLLSLRETATVPVAADLTVTTLRVERRGSVRDAQGAVNAAMAQAVGRATAVPGVTHATGSYATYQEPPSSGSERAAPVWIARQDLVLSAGPEARAALSGLVGALQDDGLMLAGIQSGISPATAEKAEQMATRMALERLRRQVDVVAEAAHLRFASFKTMRVEGAGGAPRPLMMAAKASVAAPTIEPDDVKLSVTVEAEVLLRP